LVKLKKSKNSQEMIQNIRIKEIQESYSKKVIKPQKQGLFDFLRQFQSIVTSESILFPSDMKKYMERGIIVEYIFENSFQIGIDFGNQIMNDLGNYIQKSSVNCIFEWSLKGSLSDFILLMEDFNALDKETMLNQFNSFLNEAYEKEINITSQMVSEFIFGDCSFEHLFYSHLMITSSKYVKAIDGKLFSISEQISMKHVNSFLETIENRKKEFEQTGKCKTEFNQFNDEPILKTLESFSVHDLIEDIYLNHAQVNLAKTILKRMNFEETPEGCDNLLEVIIPRPLQRGENINPRTAFSALHSENIITNEDMVKEIGALKRIVKSKIDNYHPTVDTDRVDLRHLASYAIDSRTSAFLDDAVSFDGVNYFFLLKLE
jgi:hypothetical protein